MANIFDYLDWRGDLTLSERAFNEVDNLILAEICYLDLSGFAPAGFETQQVTLREAWDAYFAAHPTTDMGVLVPDQIPVLVQKAAQTARFGSLRLLGYVNWIDEETQTQFSAMTMLLPDGSAYVAFRGTDDTIVGWKEDFNMAFTPEIPAQRYAADYLQQAAAALAFRPLLVGGHSKGGNLAVYAAVFCGEAIQKQIRAVYNNDGPGFYASLLELPEHRRIAGKITTLLPESSVVGMLLEHEEAYQVVRSTQIGLLQHDGFSWQVLGERFEHLTELAEGGRIMDQTLRSFLRELTEPQRAQFVDTLFDILTCTDASTLTDLKEGGLKTASAMVKALQKGGPAIAVINKVDLLDSFAALEARKKQLEEFGCFDHIVTISAKDGTGCDELFAMLKPYGNEGPHYFDDDAFTDMPEKELVAELVREKALLFLREEVPHGIAVVVERFKERPDKDLIDIDVDIYCERKSHKGMIIGKGGQMLKKIASAARMDIEELLGVKVNLQCWVKVREDWRDNELQLNSLGFAKP